MAVDQKKNLERLKQQSTLDTLIAGNDRFVPGKPENPHQDLARRAEVLGGQSPVAVVLCCADSRVPPELVFDQGIGDLFIVRTAGQVADDIALGSIEYAVEHLYTPLVIVLGHQKCGAVTAAVEGGEVPGRIADVLKYILPAVETAKKMKGDVVENTVDVHIKNTVERLKTNEPILKEYYDSGQLVIVGARYDLDTGKVVFLGEK